MTTNGSDILSSDYNSIRTKAVSLLGTGSGQRGYNQPIQSSDVFAGNQITKAQWDALRYDIVNIKYHQDGAVPDIVTVNSGDLIGYGASYPNNNYNTLLDSAIANKFNISPSTSTVTTKIGQTTTSTWSSSATVTVTVTFSSSDEARYFFNSGGKIRVSSSFSGSTSTLQNGAWAYLLLTVGTVSFGANTHPTLNYYTMTNSYQTVFSQAQSTPYSANNYSIEVKTDVADNSAGTAKILYFKITLNDGYTDLSSPPVPPDDSVSGTLSVAISELKASGTLLPIGDWAISSPTYSISSYSVS